MTGPELATVLIYGGALGLLLIGILWAARQFHD